MLEEEREKIDQGKLAQIKREVRKKSMEKQVEIYQNEIKKLLEENERLKRVQIPVDWCVHSRISGAPILK